MKKATKRPLIRFILSLCAFSLFVVNYPPNKFSFQTPEGFVAVILFVLLWMTALPLVFRLFIREGSKH